MTKLSKPTPITKKILREAQRKAKLIPVVSTLPPPCSKLLTKSQVISRIRSEIADSSLTTTAAKYDLKPSQISDAIYGRANLSKKMLAKLALRMHEFYEVLGMNGGSR